MKRIALTALTTVLAAGAAQAAPFTSTSMTGSATASADTNFRVGLLGIEIELDDLDLPTTNLGVTGQATADVNNGNLSLSELSLQISDLNLGPITDSDSDSLGF
ncbi:MAG: hypothetical protein AAF593_01925 [Planctomycetota bacterium]